MGNSFTILTASTLGGTKFGTTNLPTLPAGSGWQVNYNTNSVVLSIVSVLTVVTLGATSLNFPNTREQVERDHDGVAANGTAPLTIVSIQPAGVDGANYVYSTDATKPRPISPATLGNGATCIIDIAFTPQSAGTHNSAQVTVTDNNGGVTGSTQTVSLTGTGIVLSSIQITAPNQSIISGATDQFSATGTYSDNSTANLTAQVAWASDNTAVASINAAGLATGAATGTAHITGALSGITSNSFSLTVTPSVPASISISSGSNQNATVNTTFANPLVALVRDAASNPVPNVTVTFTAQSNAGSSGVFANGTNTTTAVTDAIGHATSSAFTANTTAGGYTVLATISTFSASFPLTNTAASASSIAATGGSGQTANISTQPSRTSCRRP